MIESYEIVVDLVIMKVKYLFDRFIKNPSHNI
jgi:hypothetical protein